MSKEEDYALYQSYANGEFDYNTWTHKIEDYYKERGELTAMIAEAALTTYTLRTGARELIIRLQNAGHRIVLITGGFRATAQALAHELGVDTYRYVTDIAWTTKGQFSHFLSDGEEGGAKLLHLQQYCQATGTPIHDCVPVGDSTNDIPLFRATGNGVTFNWCKEAVRTEARYTIEDFSHFPALT